MLAYKTVNSVQSAGTIVIAFKLIIRIRNAKALCVQQPASHSRSHRLRRHPRFTSPQSNAAGQILCIQTPLHSVTSSPNAVDRALACAHVAQSAQQATAERMSVSLTNGGYCVVQNGCVRGAQTALAWRQRGSLSVMPCHTVPAPVAPLSFILLWGECCLIACRVPVACGM